MSWEKLIKIWCEDKGRYGLTIPFLIGSERLNGEMTIGSFLKEVVDSDMDYFISDCEDLDEYVIGLQKSEYAYLGSLKRIGFMVLNDSDLEHIENLEELVQIMENEYQGLIDNEYYSKDYDSGEWSNFNKKDFAFIASAR